MVRQMAIAGVLMGLVGCSTPPPRSAPMADAQWYTAVGKNEAWVDACTEKGYMPVTTGGKARSLISQAKEESYYYAAQLNQIKSQFSRIITANEPNCAVVAQQIESMYLDATQQQQRPRAAVQQGYKYTNCSTHFGQTHCYSY